MTNNIGRWLAINREKSQLQVRRIQLNESKEWSLSEGVVFHHTGGFFSLIGVKSISKSGVLYQPLIHQPEIGILGFLIREEQEGWEILCQAKTEPGNICETQIAPTFQATESNYNQIHGGQPQAFSELFLSEERTFLTDQLQSEQGFRFWKKRNRNCVSVNTVGEDVDVGEQHQWISLQWILTSINKDYLFNTDFRSVLVQLFFGHFFLKADRNKQFSLLHWNVKWDEDDMELTRIASWLTQRKKKSTYHHEGRELKSLDGWEFNDLGIQSDRRTFGIQYFDIDCQCREVAQWDQPLMISNETALNRLVICYSSYRLYFLLQFREEPGAYDVGEFSCTTQSMDEIESKFYPQQLNWELVASSNPTSLISVATSEEGGRFYQNKTMNEMVSVTSRFDPQNENYLWISLESLCGLITQSNKVTNELRTMLSMLLGCKMG